MQLYIMTHPCPIELILAILPPPLFPLILCLLLGLQSCNKVSNFFTPASTEVGLTSDQLAIIVNQSDPLSVKIATYYQQQRRIPQSNIIPIKFTPGRTQLLPAEFERLYGEVVAQLPAGIQVFALTWAAPYRVGCMSITAAFALGFDQSYCANGCQSTKLNPYFNSTSIRPYRDLKIRPTMSIAAKDFEQAKALIDRGIAADYTHPPGTAYLLSTSDKARNVRAIFYPSISQSLSDRFKVEVIKSDVLRNRGDVMFYFTGLPQVAQLNTNRFLPGAVADHLTSTGGMLIDSSQMSSLRWLEAGATGSYGAVVEPCNFPQKFPRPDILMTYYLMGNTLVEAYWKSVAWPGQGIFIGEPLARPFARASTQ